MALPRSPCCPPRVVFRSSTLVAAAGSAAPADRAPGLGPRAAQRARVVRHTASLWPFCAVVVVRVVGTHIPRGTRSWSSSTAVLVAGLRREVRTSGKAAAPRSLIWPSVAVSATDTGHRSVPNRIVLPPRESCCGTTALEPEPSCGGTRSPRGVGLPFRRSARYRRYGDGDVSSPAMARPPRQAGLGAI